MWQLSLVNDEWRGRVSWRTVTVLLLSATAALAQSPVGLAFKGAVHGAGWFPSTSGREHASDLSAHWGAGPAVEFRFSERTAFEAAALYRRLRTEGGSDNSITPWSFTTRGSGWEFPMVAKFRVLPRIGGSVQPFLAGGGSVLRISTTTENRGIKLVYDPVHGGPIGQPYFTTSSAQRTIGGFTFGGGLEQKAGRIRLTFDARLTIWGSRETIQFGGGPITGPTQFLFLAGFGV